MPLPEDNAPTAMLDTAVELKIDLIRKPCELSLPPRSWRDGGVKALN